MTTTIVVVSVIAGLLVVWFCYMLIKSGDVLKDIEGSDAPYKVEPADTAPEVAYWRRVSDKPKRKYTKRSSFWTAKRKKAAARKAKKKTRKSK